MFHDQNYLNRNISQLLLNLLKVISIYSETLNCSNSISDLNHAGPRCYTNWIN